METIRAMILHFLANRMRAPDQDSKHHFTLPSWNCLAVRKTLLCTWYRCKRWQKDGRFWASANAINCL